ncbi:MAG: toprim domain-containing protein [Rikenellaceae bacterium]
MTIDQAKNIKIADYLQAIGYTPTKTNGNTLMYLSPLRDERTASFKVDSERNVWYDFGLSVGGNIIDLVMQLNNTRSVSEALAHIGGQRIIVAHIPAVAEHSTQLENMTIEPLRSPALIELLRERNISISVAQKLCREIHYTRGGKHYFSIAFANDKGGYEMRNRYYKGCVAPKTITTDMSDRSICYLFEGFMDLLSFKTLEERANRTNADYAHIVLNSTSQLTPEVIDRLRQYDAVHTFLDNDESGKAATAKLIAELGDKVVNRSVGYSEYKDVNDYLCGRRMEVEQPTITPKRGMRM